jgi:electron transfer flavoprotein alpha/beta subunit
LNVAGERLAPKIELLEVLAPKTERKKIRIAGESPQEIAKKLAEALVQEGVVGR